MIWIVLAIIIVGIFIVRAVNNNTRTNIELANQDDNSEGYDATLTEVNVEAARHSNMLALYGGIYNFMVQGKNDADIASNAQLRNYAVAAGIPLNNYRDSKAVRLSPEFLNVTGLFGRIDELHEAGRTDAEIAKQLIQDRPKLRAAIYKANEIENIRVKQ